MSAAAVNQGQTLEQVWKEYYENFALLSLYCEGKEKQGSIASHIELIQTKIEQLAKDPLIFRADFGRFTEQEMDFLVVAQQASECGDRILKDLRETFHASLPKGQTRAFPFTVQEDKLKELIQKVDDLCALLENSLLAAFGKEEDANRVGGNATPPLADKKDS